MKFLLFALLPILLLTTAAAQTTEKAGNTITVMGYARLPLTGTAYKAYIFIQEEENKVGYTTIGKTVIDSIRKTLFSNLKKFGIDEKDLVLTGTSSRDLNQFPGFLINNLYKYTTTKKLLAVSLVNELRFTGLKGMVIKHDVTPAAKAVLAEAVYNEALADAKKAAVLLATRANKTVGEIKNIDVNANSVNTIGADYESDYYNPFSFGRFEMDYREKFAYCNIRVSYELK